MSTAGLEDKPLAAEEAAHLWRRAGFGASAQTIERSSQQGLEATVDELLTRRTHDSALHEGIRPLLALGEIEALQAWWMALILSDRAPLVERMTLVWHDHFATSWDKVQDVRTMHVQNELFRTYGLGDFRELLHAVTCDPAMLVWLDGTRNRRGEPNENYARELMELFALGIGHYDEHDVAETARALTGLGVDGRRSVFREIYHDPGRKTIFNQRGAFDARQAVGLVLAHPACARHVARRLLCEFVHPKPDERDTRQWAKRLIENDWNIARTLRQLFTSELFFSTAARRSRIAGPIEVMARTCLTLDLSPSPAAAARAAAEMGQSLFRPPSVKGWDGGRSWIHAGSWIARHNHLTSLVLGDDAPLSNNELARLRGETQKLQEIPGRVLSRLLPELRDADFLRTLQDAASNSDSAETAVRRVLALVLTSPEYHLA